MAYRAVVDSSNGKDLPALLAYLRWNLQLWTEADRKEWKEVMARAWQEEIKRHPVLQTTKH